VRTYEALGQCFLEKKQWQVAATILQRADAEPDEGDEQLVGVLYLLGYAMEALQKPQEALMYYQRVFAVDIQFRDVTERLDAVEKVAR
jgi:tetratricopeptide (TPR) repeat protein